MTQIQTVLGPVKKGDLGFTLPHEHIICDALLCRSRSKRTKPPPWGSYMWFDEPGVMIEELIDYRKNGGASIVEVTCHGWGRDPIALREISKKSGVNIVATTGFYVENCMPSWVPNRTVEQLSDWIVREIEFGCNARLSDKVTDIRAGLIKTSVSRPHFTGEELRG